MEGVIFASYRQGRQSFFLFGGGEIITPLPYLTPPLPLGRPWIGKWTKLMKEQMFGCHIKIEVNRNVENHETFIKNICMSSDA